MRFAALVVSPCAASVLFWLAFTACIDSPLEPDPPPIARVIVQWDPLACGDPSRVAVELEDHAGVRLASSAPCTAGSVTIDTAHYGLYYARIDACEADEDLRAIAPVRLVVDEPVVRWHVATPATPATPGAAP